MTVVGTQIYMAPEVIASNKLYSFKADIYSLGLLLNEAGSLIGGWSNISPAVRDLTERMTSVA